MFKNTKQTKSFVQTSSLIGSMSAVEGDVYFQNNLHVRGKITGNIISQSEQGELSIFKSGRITGNIKVSRVIIDGQVKGDITCKSISIDANARIEGNIYYEVLQMQANSVINGQLVVSNEYAKLKHESANLSQVEDKPSTIKKVGKIK